MGIMSALGMMAKPIFSPVFNAITDFIRIPGGSVTAGVSMMFIVFTAAYIHKKGAGALMGLCQALVSLSTGMGAAAGLLVVFTYTLPGVAIDLVLLSPLYKKDLKLCMMTAGACGVLAGAGATNILFFHLNFVSFILFYFFGILSGALGGYIAWSIYKRIGEYV